MRTFTMAVCVGLILHIHFASAQHVANLSPLTALPSPDDSVRAFRLWTRADSANRQPTRVWPISTLTGAVIGGAIVAGVALTHCDQGCRDDGALAFAPPFIAAGAAAGGLLGLGIGLIVDSSRRGTVGLRISVPVP